MPGIRKKTLALFLCALLPLCPISVAALDVSGTYISKYTSKRGVGKPVVFLNQNGNKITAQFDWDLGDETDGTIENGIIKFKWWSRKFSERRGSLKIFDDGKRIEGTWHSHHGSNKGEWTLIKDEGALPTDLYDDPNVLRFETKLEALELETPDKPLSGFAQFQLAEMTVDEKIQDMYAFTEKVREFESKLRSGILPLMDQWNAHGDLGTGTLLVKPHLHSFKFVSASTRDAGIAVDPVISGLAGNSHIDLELVLVDASTGKDISRVMIRKHTGDIVQVAATNLTSVAVYDQLVLDYVAAIAYEYLAGNNELTQTAISSSSPALGDILSEDADPVPVEYIGIAATEFASKTYDKKQWQQSIELAKGNPEKQIGIYIKLRSKQLSDQAKKEQSTSVIPSEELPNINISGTYNSEITYTESTAKKSRRWYFGTYPDIQVRIGQNGDLVIAEMEGDRSGHIKGTLEGNTVTFEFDLKVPGGSAKFGTGQWLLNTDQTTLKGTWEIRHSGKLNEGNWNLTKVD